jgi:hypothetical protein
MGNATAKNKIFSARFYVGASPALDESASRFFREQGSLLPQRVLTLEGEGNFFKHYFKASSNNS